MSARSLPSKSSGTQKSRGFRFLSVILASLLSGSIDDVLGDLLGDDSKYSFPGQGRQTGKSGGRKPDHLSSTLGPTWGKERISVSKTEGFCFGHTHQCLFPNFGFSFDFVPGLGSRCSTEQYPQPVYYFVFCARVSACCSDWPRTPWAPREPLNFPFCFQSSGGHSLCHQAQLSHPFGDSHAVNGWDVCPPSAVECLHMCLGQFSIIFKKCLLRTLPT